MSSERPTRRTKRSFWTRMFIAGLFLLSLTGWLRLQQSIVHWDYLMEIGLRPGPLYLALTGTLAGLAGLAAGISMWLRLRLGVYLAGGVIILWQAWNWIDRLWISSSPTVLANWPFALTATLVILVYAYLVLREEWRRK